MANDLFITVGCMASGKSTLLKPFEPIVLSTDTIRLQLGQPTKKGIDQTCTGKMLKILDEYLDYRCSKGCTSVIDACHSTIESITRYYKYIEQYGYKVWIIDFRHVPLKECLLNNKNRPTYKWVPEDVIITTYNNLQMLVLPSWAQRITPEKVLPILIKLKTW